MKKKPVVWYVDDLPSNLERFKNNHQQAFKVRTFSMASMDRTQRKLLSSKTSKIFISRARSPCASLIIFGRQLFGSRFLGGLVVWFLTEELPKLLSRYPKYSEDRERNHLCLYSRILQNLFHVAGYYKIGGVNDRPSRIPDGSQMLCKILSVSGFRSSEITVDKTEVELFAVECFDGLAHCSADDAIGKPRFESLAAFC